MQRGRRPGADAEAEAPRRGTLLRAARISGRRRGAGRTDCRHRQGARRPGAATARRRTAQARRQGVRVRARAAVRPVAADRVPPPEGAEGGRDRRRRAAGAVGVLLCDPRGAGGADRMAELTDIRETVREKYAAAATAGTGCGGGESCCSPADDAGVFGSSLYDEAGGDESLQPAVEASLGCGVPTAVADLHPGEVVLDLGSGGGADVLISARRVGPSGRAIGLDMTDEMLALARANAAQAGVENA